MHVQVLLQTLVVTRRQCVTTTLNTGPPTFQILRRVVGDDVLVGLGVPLGHVDPVGDPVELVPLAGEQLMQPPAALWSGHLPRVALADGDDAVRGDDAALEQVDRGAGDSGPVRKAPADGVVKVLWQAELPVDGRGLHALVAQVVDRKDGAGVGVDAMAAVAAGQEARHEAGVPVVGHKDAVVAIGKARWLPVTKAADVEAQGSFAGCQAEQGVPKDVVLKRSARGIAVGRAWVGVQHRVCDATC